MSTQTLRDNAARFRKDESLFNLLKRSEKRKEQKNQEGPNRRIQKLDK